MFTPANDNPVHIAPVSSLALLIGALTGIWRVLAAMLFGLAATLTLSPFYFLPLLPVAFCGLYWLLVAVPSRRRAALDGWWFGVGMFASGLYWIANALLVDAEKFGWLVPIAAVGISGGLALFPALAAAVFFRFRRLGGFRGVWLFALLWSAEEWLRGHLLTGFPWNLTGYAWSFSDTTLQLYSFLGVYLTGLLSVVLALLPAAFIVGDRITRRACALYAAGFLLLLGLGYQRVADAPHAFVPGVMLRLVQPAIAQSLKWDPDYQAEGLQKIATLSMSAGREQVTHVIWPESAMPFPFNSGDVWAKRLAELVPPGGVLMTGTTRFTGSRDAGNLQVYNSVQAVDGSGEVVMRYDKAQLVPFGEFVPLRSVLPLEKITPGTLDFSRGEAGRSYKVGAAPPFRPLICYESIFPALAEGAYPAWLLNVTNDAWFGDSTGPRQHFEMARARAVEQGVPLVRVANTGISAVVDGYGRILRELPLGATGVIDAPLPEAASHPAFFAQYGDYITIFLVFFSGILLCSPAKSKILKQPAGERAID